MRTALSSMYQLKNEKKKLSCVILFNDAQSVVFSAPLVERKHLTHPYPTFTGLKVNDQLVAYATRFLAVRQKKKVWSHHRALKAKA